MALDCFMHNCIDRMLCGIEVEFLTAGDIRLDFLVYFTKRAKLATLRVQFEAINILTVDAGMCDVLLISEWVAPMNVVS